MTESASPSSTSPSPATLQQLLRAAGARLLQAAREAGEAQREEEARLDAELLLAHALDKPRQYLYTWPERQADAEQAARFERLLQARLRGEPVAYLLGMRAFWTLELQVSPAVLIPRPETELLVELCLERLDLPQARVADLGTGSGAIALALASERPGWQVLATDASASALAVARGNAERHGLGNVGFRQGDWLQALGGERFHALLSNPPYIEEEDPHLLRGDLRFEPRGALASGVDGLRDLRAIVGGAPAHLLPGGWLLVEHGWRQGEAVRALLAESGFQDVSSQRDLAGHERVSLGRLALLPA